MPHQIAAYLSCEIASEGDNDTNNLKKLLVEGWAGDALA
jgi:hypothetical protein